MYDISFSQCRTTHELLCINSCQHTALSLSMLTLNVSVGANSLNIAKVNFWITLLQYVSWLTGKQLTRTSPHVKSSTQMTVSREWGLLVSYIVHWFYMRMGLLILCHQLCVKRVKKQTSNSHTITGVEVIELQSIPLCKVQYSRWYM